MSRIPGFNDFFLLFKIYRLIIKKRLGNIDSALTHSIQKADKAVK